jgi:hypothetical protein
MQLCSWSGLEDSGRAWLLSIFEPRVSAGHDCRFGSCVEGLP